MSVKIMSLVFEAMLPKDEKAALLALADHADNQGRNIYPSYLTLAMKTSYTRRSMIRTVERLQKPREEYQKFPPRGAILVFRGRAPEPYQSNNYSIDIPELKKLLYPDYQQPPTYGGDTTSPPQESSDTTSPPDQKSGDTENKSSDTHAQSSDTVSPKSLLKQLNHQVVEEDWKEQAKAWMNATKERQSETPASVKGFDEKIKAWNDCKEFLSGSTPTNIFNKYIEPTILYDYDPTEYNSATSITFFPRYKIFTENGHIPWLEDRVEPLAKRYLTGVEGCEIQLSWITTEDEK